MKRIICLSLALMITGLLVGCGAEQKETKQAPTTTVNWTKGESLFGSMLKKYADACKNNNTKGIKAKEKLSTGFSEVGKEKNLSKKIGYSFADLNGDGTEELLVSIIDKKHKLNNNIIAAYTYTSEGIKRLLEGWSRNTYHLMRDKMILNHASGGVKDAEIAVLHMRENGFEYMRTLSIKEGKKDKVVYLYASVGKPENKKKFQVSKDEWTSTLKDWESQIDVSGVKPIAEFK